MTLNFLQKLLMWSTLSSYYLKTSIPGNPGLNIRLEDDYLVFESDTALSRMRIKFADKCVLGQADLDSESEEGTQVLYQLNYQVNLH